MKLNGVKIEGPNEEVIIVPRKNGDLIFVARAVIDYKEFDKICSLPNPPEILKPGGIRIRNSEDPEFLEALDKWATLKTHWQMLKSLSATPGLEWETVEMSNIDTWGNYTNELISSGFSPAEIALLVNGVMIACGLSQQRIEEARERFLAGQGVKLEEQCSHNTEQKNTPSGEPVNDSGLDLQVLK